MKPKNATKLVSAFLAYVKSCLRTNSNNPRRVKQLVKVRKYWESVKRKATRPLWNRILGL